MTPQSFYRQDAKNAKFYSFYYLCIFALAVILALVCLALPIWVLASPPAQEQVSGNLLADGDFEAPPLWPMQDGIGEVQVAPGWRAYYLDEPSAGVPVPDNCLDQPRHPDCYWMRPEFRDNTSFANRIHSGERSQKYFSYGRMHEAGLMQRVRGIPPGARVRFSIWIQAWMCADSAKCKGGTFSDAPADMHLRVGIDPYGGADPFASTVAWSPEKPAWDEWVQFQVETQAVFDAVTVFTHSRADWSWARVNNDVYLDDASLVIVGAYLTTTVTPTLQMTARPTGTLRTATPSPTATPLPPGAITYTVEMGNTLFDVALKHGVTVSDLLKLNQIPITTELFIGQPLVVQIAPVTPTTLPQPTEPPAIAPSPEASATPTLGATPLPGVTAAPMLPTPPAATAPPRAFPISAVALIGAGLLVVALGVWMRRAASRGEEQVSPIQVERLRKEKR